MNKVGLIVLLLAGCGGTPAPFTWPSTQAGLAALADCGNTDVVCPDGDMCSDGNDCYPLCVGFTPTQSCNDVGACDGAYACVHGLCAPIAGTPACPSSDGGTGVVSASRPHLRHVSK